jgi:branched-subunit amino acid ABC-type transport system permease component
MKKLPLKWKLFMVFSYVQLFAFGAITCLIIYMIPTYPHFSTSDKYSMGATVAGILTVCINSLLIIYTISRYFPDTPAPSKIKKFTKVTGILTAILWLIFLLICISGWYAFPKEDVYDDGYSYKTLRLFIIILSFLWLLGLYTLILQARLYRFLNNNYNKKMTALLDSLGKK